MAEQLSALKVLLPSILVTGDHAPCWYAAYPPDESTATQLPSAGQDTATADVPTDPSVHCPWAKAANEPLPSTAMQKTGLEHDTAVKPLPLVSTCVPESHAPLL